MTQKHEMSQLGIERVSANNIGTPRETAVRWCKCAGSYANAAHGSRTVRAARAGWRRSRRRWAARPGPAGTAAPAPCPSRCTCIAVHHWRNKLGCQAQVTQGSQSHHATCTHYICQSFSRDTQCYRACADIASFMQAAVLQTLLQVGCKMFYHASALAVLGDGGGADAAQLAAPQHRLQQVACSGTRRKQRSSTSGSAIHSERSMTMHNTTMCARPQPTIAAA